MFDIISIYRDPIFGIIVLVAVVGIVALADYSKNRFSRHKKKKSLDNISKSFESFMNLNSYRTVNDSIKEFIKSHKDPISVLIPIAEVYLKTGDHEQAIFIYLALLNKVQKTNQKIDILEQLGICYYKAGFLQRAKGIFLDALKIYPNNPKILSYLIRTCESMGLYDEALESLNCIEEIQNINSFQFPFDVKSNRNYLLSMKIISNYKINEDDKIKQLHYLLTSNNDLRQVILRYFRIHNLKLFWETITEIDNAYPYLDMLWDFKLDEVPFVLIDHNESIKNIFRAKGYIRDDVELNIFYLETIRTLSKHSKTKGDLEFSYRCHECKNIFPFYSHRCQICSSIGKMNLLSKPIRLQNLDY